MALGWNEIKERAVRFSKELNGAFNEVVASATLFHRNKTD